MSDRVTADVRLTDGKVQFTASTRDNPPVVFDYFPPLGDGHGYTGLEGLLLSLAACSATSVVGLLRQAGKTVSGFEVQAAGMRRTRHPTCFETISLHFSLTSSDAAAPDMEKAIALSESTVCPVWAMVKGNVEITTSHEITKGG